MSYKVVFSLLFSLFLSTANANWTKINDVNYTWGPFNIYHITLFTESGTYVEGTRPLMLTLQYKKPWEGRDFAVSLARTWNNLGIKLPEKELDEVITHLRKTFPDIKPEDTLHYIALEYRGYFILNDKVVSDVFNKAFNDAIVAIWLDPKMDISHQLLDPSYKPRVESKNIESQAEEKSAEVKAQEPIANTEVSKEMKEFQTVEQESNKTETLEVDKTQSSVANEATQPVENKDKKEPEKLEEKPKEMKIENPEVFISPIYDDILMLTKYCV
ncbi:dihydroorotate dehydrogenase [Mannheimia haemolytica]|uniref:dihydroorotate dehydrogenase n=1 Tax=Mannheimia haemolytica TaxID=75985 RepID=UPI000385C87D|nr:dihydroorotate dehydrogenase [Mannheimia haemolytica]EPY99205.1 dihydroorotate dehydrogenase [Mannheimia haemolytica D35]MDW0617902.1 dihydroorotate dehydrogenase [Mannheimia haemolytica]MDW1148863.1 dihydroorotate dehydrogenase [Mannheimia haemolytica]MDW1159206.1 dihydroorotate dehydrogenase [Mannheimia haemolytica]NBB66807.1 dihydroorotate dehydrogenase [Mannheimia haemolytica]